MQFNLASVSRAESIARSLKKKLLREGYEIKKPMSQALMARMFGFPNWNALLALTGRVEPSPFDDAVAPEVVAARRAQHIAVLIDWGVAPAHAEPLVDEIRPTVSAHAEALGAEPRLPELDPVAGDAPCRSVSGQDDAATNPRASTRDFDPRPASRIDERWRLDFLSSDVGAIGRRLSLAIVDEVSGERLATVAVDQISGDRIARELDRLIQTRGLPRTLVSDNAFEFHDESLAQWRRARGVPWMFMGRGRRSIDGR